MSQKILVVEDEVAIANGLCDCLRFNDFEVDWKDNGKDALTAGLTGAYDLVLLDVMLPDLNGFEICKQLRASLPEQSIIMLTAKGAESDILEGFSRGADDYICKPFSVAQLIARIKALLRRNAAEEAKTEADICNISDFAIGALEICVDHLQARYQNEHVEINRRDMELLQLFAEEPGRIVSRRRILKDIWDYAQPDAVETRSVDMHIAKLRKKLAQINSPGAIVTVRGEGYRWSV